MGSINESNLVILNMTTFKRRKNMTKSKHEKERQWNIRKQSQDPHGKVKSFEELADEVTPQITTEKRGE